MILFYSVNCAARSVWLELYEGQSFNESLLNARDWSLPFSHVLDLCLLARCDNNSVHCRAWADRGECRANPEYMDIYCSKACRSGSCSKQNRDCKDKNKGRFVTILIFWLQFNMFRLRHVGQEGLLSDRTVCELYEAELQENMQIVLMIVL